MPSATTTSPGFRPCLMIQKSLYQGPGVTLLAETLLSALITKTYMPFCPWKTDFCGTKIAFGLIAPDMTARTNWPGIMVLSGLEKVARTTMAPVCGSKVGEAKLTCPLQG